MERVFAIASWGRKILYFFRKIFTVAYLSCKLFQCSDTRSCCEEFWSDSRLIEVICVQRLFAFSKASGQKAAQYVLHEYPHTFAYDPAEPQIKVCLCCLTLLILHISNGILHRTFQTRVIREGICVTLWETLCKLWWVGITDCQTLCIGRHWWFIFSRIISNSKHILQQFLHDRTTTYSLRSRIHSKALISKTSHLNNSEFLIRLLYKYSY